MKLFDWFIGQFFNAEVIPELTLEQEIAKFQLEVAKIIQSLRDDKKVLNKEIEYLRFWLQEAVIVASNVSKRGPLEREQAILQLASEYSEGHIPREIWPPEQFEAMLKDAFERVRQARSPV